MRNIFKTIFMILYLGILASSIYASAPEASTDGQGYKSTRIFLKLIDNYHLEVVELLSIFTKEQKVLATINCSERLQNWILRDKNQKVIFTADPYVTVISSPDGTEYRVNPDDFSSFSSRITNRLKPHWALGIQDVRDGDHIDFRVFLHLIEKLKIDVHYEKYGFFGLFIPYDFGMQFRFKGFPNYDYMTLGHPRLP